MKDVSMFGRVGFIGGRGFFSNYGGVENAIRETCLELSKKNIDIDIVVYGYRDTNDIIFQLPDNITTIMAPNWLYRQLGQFALIFYNTLHAIFISRPSVIVVFASGPCIFAPLFRLSGIRVVCSLRAIDSQRDKWGFLSSHILRVGEYFAWRFSNVFTVNSKEMVRHFSNKRSDSKFIPNGCRMLKGEETDLTKAFGNRPYFLFAARLDPVKRLHLLLQAHHNLDPENRPILVVAGGNSKDIAYEKELKRYAGNDVIFLGHIAQAQLETLIQRCVAFVMPSILEGMSNSLLSAMINGRPVVVANIDANSDVVSNSMAEFEADNIHSLMAKLIEVATDLDYGNELGQSLKERALTNYTWEATSLEFLNAIYEARGE
jgi:glycosyltransferase involved in cell wall biosynthesis